MFWTVSLEGGPRRVNHAAVVVNDKIYSFGGYCTGENYHKKRAMDVHVLNTANYRWTVLPLPNYTPETEDFIPYQRYGHTAVEYKNKVYIWGGRNDEAACNKLFIFDPVTQHWSSPRVQGYIPTARDGHSACVISHYMYIFGGFEEILDRFSQDVFCLDLETLTWRQVKTKNDPPSYRDFHSASAIGSYMFVFGGRGDVYGPQHSQEEIYSNEIMYLDTVTGQWHQPHTFGNIPLGRRSHSAFVYKGNLFIFGGYNGILDEHFNDLYQFQPGSNIWKILRPHGKPPSRRRRQSCLVIKDKIFLFGGTSPKHGVLPMETEDLYNEGVDVKLMDHDDLFVLDFAPTLYTLCLVFVISHSLDQSGLPEELRYEIRSMTAPNSISRPLNTAG